VENDVLYKQYKGEFAYVTAAQTAAYCIFFSTTESSCNIYIT